MSFPQQVLWKTPSHPDNHVPPSFLSSLSQPPLHPPPSLNSLFLYKSLPQITYLSSISIYISLFRALLDDRISPPTIIYTLILSSALLLTLHATRHPLTPTPTPTPPPTPLRTRSTTLILPPLILYLLSPLLLSLTKATTSDTIWPLAAGLFALGGLLGGFGGSGIETMDDGMRTGGKGVTSAGGASRTSRYSSIIPSEKSLKSSLSLTSSLSASTVLASRLPTPLALFSLLSFISLTTSLLVYVHSTHPSPQARYALTAGLYLLAMGLARPQGEAENVPGCRVSWAQVGLAVGGVLLGAVGPWGLRMGWRWRVG